MPAALTKPHEPLPRWALFAAAVGAASALPHVPYLGVIARPFHLFKTLVHELGHGLTALLVGGQFGSLVVHLDGSGVAQTAASGRITGALVAAGGLVGPAVAGALCFALARTARTARAGLAVFGAFLLLADLFWVRSFVGLLVATSAAALMLAIARRGSGQAAQLALAFFGAELALSAYASRSYLFTDTAHTASGDMPSDVAAMASALLLPYWFWGALCAAFSIAVLAVGSWAFLRQDRARP